MDDRLGVGPRLRRVREVVLRAAPDPLPGLGTEADRAPSCPLGASPALRSALRSSPPARTSQLSRSPGPPGSEGEASDPGGPTASAGSSGVLVPRPEERSP